MTARPVPGTRMTFRWRKWDGAPHWEHDSVFLGSDAHGDWVGQRDGWRSARPGVVAPSHGDSITLIPPSGEFAATINDTHPRIRVYIDIGWDVRWDGGRPTGIDMDLDVVRALDGRGVFIDDLDEWAEHREQYGYPGDIVERLESVARELESQVAAATSPFDDATAAYWFEVLRDLGSNDD
ncbi:DUF402 domain-containing protein [Microbacterium sp.]|uniref:DUF402 domain-containing protein n=1 Tax=Microbacterium sp. TaxID=51671 RepID=UPI0025CBAB23|nr:DUF402 domain-containing protein [Microbacterium sp.]